MKSQKERLLDYLKAGANISRLEGWDRLGIIELPARVSELRQEGHEIQTDMEEVTNRYGEKVRVARWSLIERVKQ